MANARSWREDLITRLLVALRRLEAAPDVAPEADADQVRHLVFALDLATARLAPQSGDRAQAGPGAEFAQVALEYRADSLSQHRSARSAEIGAFCLALIVTVSTAIAAWRGMFEAGLSPGAVAYVMLQGAIALIAAGLVLTANRYRRLSLESSRLERQIRLLDDYLEPFPEPSRRLMRAALAPRVFPRILEDLDPLSPDPP